jgi:pyrimidine-nucleoside phosphorylase
MTEAMVNSGKRVDLSHLNRFPVDKHSTGGVGDKVSLILAPLVAAAGVAVPMISGRGLGHSGGTLDKLEAIPGFQTNLPLSKYVSLLETEGLAMIGQSEQIVPADRRLYALRDSIGTVPSIPLVVSSIMSKKIAEGARAIVMDVKVGNGAFFKSLSAAMELTRTLIAIGERYELKTTALLTAMDQPLGYAVGNWLETLEAVQMLKAKGPKDLETVTFALGAEMLRLAGQVSDLSEGEKILRSFRDSGSAYEKFLAMVKEQNGDVTVIEHPEKFPPSKYNLAIASNQNGYIHSINAYEIGMLAMELGAGRKKMNDKIDYKAGIVFRKKQGDAVKIGEPLADVVFSKSLSNGYIKEKLQHAIQIAESIPQKQKLILKYVNSNGDFDWQGN